MTRPDAPSLLRAVGLLADGPVRWGQPVPARGPGLYLVELPAPLPAPGIDLTVVGKWLERVPGLRLDGARPSSRALLARLASLWLPDAAVVYAAGTANSIGGRVAALQHQVVGDPRPHADGQWLHLLRELPTTRIWWAATPAPEEYLDAVLDAFAGGGSGPVTLPSGLSRPDGALPLPWACTRRPTGERQASGLTGSVLPLPKEPAPPPTRVVQLEPGVADGASLEAKGSGTVRRRPTPPKASASSGSTARPGRAAAPARPDAGPVEVSPEAHARMLAELEQLTQHRRPEVVARIKAARELGDLRENSEYHAAREEQSFLEGRIQLLEQRLRRAVLVTAPEASGGGDGSAGGGGRGASLGSRVTIELNGLESVFTLVGSTEANVAEGRISTSSPVGGALLGAAPGSEVSVRTPRGDVRYRVLAVD
ncbi:MAG TPA: transcription elongation factor GreA [Candidatus Limnocylindrales bacterium]